MKKIIQGLTVATLLVGSSAFAGNGFLSVGYADVAREGGESQTGVSLNLGAKFGKSFKQRFGMEYIFVNSDDNGQATVGNSIDFYYTLGYEVYKDFTVGANVGYGFESIDTIGSGSNQVDVYASGLSYGATLTYEISRHFEAIAEYKKYDLDYEGISFAKDVTTVSLGYVF